MAGNRSLNHTRYRRDDDSAFTFNVEEVDRNGQTLHEFGRVNEAGGERAGIFRLQIWIASDNKRGVWVYLTAGRRVIDKRPKKTLLRAPEEFDE